MISRSIKPEFALEILTNIKDNFPKPLLEYWGESVVISPFEWFKAAQKKAIEIGAKYVSVYFNIDDENKIEDSLELFKKIQENSRLPLIVRGSGNKTIDFNFIPKLVNLVNKPAIVAFAQDTNFEPIVKSVVLSKYSDAIRLVLRAPIDITLTKELNVLSSDLGLNPENIIMDTDTGCVGMGLDYGYSIIERLCIARAEGDSVLNPPIIVFAGEESFKAKESKSDDFKDTRGKLETRFTTIETATAAALLTAGANIAVCWNPKTIETLAPLYFEPSKEAV